MAFEGTLNVLKSAAGRDQKLFRTLKAGALRATREIRTNYREYNLSEAHLPILKDIQGRLQRAQTPDQVQAVYKITCLLKIPVRPQRIISKPNSARAY